METLLDTAIKVAGKPVTEKTILALKALHDRETDSGEKGRIAQLVEAQMAAMDGTELLPFLDKVWA